MLELIPYNSRHALGRLRGDFDDLWSRLFEGVDKPVLKDAPAFAPKVDVKETEESFEVTAEIPGIKPEELDVSLNGDILTIKGEKKLEEEKKEGNYHLVERSYGSFSRSFRLPKVVDREKLKASHKDGILTISLPKGEREGATKIEVSG